MVAIQPVVLQKNLVIEFRQKSLFALFNNFDPPGFRFNERNPNVFIEWPLSRILSIQTLMEEIVGPFAEYCF